MDFKSGPCLSCSHLLSHIPLHFLTKMQEKRGEFCNFIENHRKKRGKTHLRPCRSLSCPRYRTAVHTFQHKNESSKIRPNRVQILFKQWQNSCKTHSVMSHNTNQTVSKQCPSIVKEVFDKGPPSVESYI